MVNKLVAAAETDPAAEAGAWFEFNPAGTPFRVKLARVGPNNQAFTKELEQRVRPYRQGVRDNNAVIPPDVERKINAELYAKHVVLDWDAEAVGEPYSVDACVKAFLQAPDFLAWAMGAASNAESFRKRNIEANAGNSHGHSDTN